jgi:lipopolysaccharide biosynthesis regulator YciM
VENFRLDKFEACALLGSFISSEFFILIFAKKNNEIASFCVDLASIYYSVSDYEKSIEYFRIAVKASPKSAWIKIILESLFSVMDRLRINNRIKKVC